MPKKATKANNTAKANKSARASKSTKSSTRSAQEQSPEPDMQQPVSVEPSAQKDKVQEPPKNRKGVVRAREEEHEEIILEEEQEEDTFPDPEARLYITTDPAFDETHPAIIPQIPKGSSAFSWVEKFDFPSINTDENPSALAVLTFVHDILPYKDVEPSVLQLILSKAIRGSEGRSWCRTFRFNFDCIISKLINRMMQEKEWEDLICKVIKGVRFSDDIETHIRTFKMVAKYMGMEADDERTKRLFIKSMGPGVLLPSTVVNRSGKTEAFKKLVQMALANRAAFSQVAQEAQGVAAASVQLAAPSGEGPAPEEGGVAAVAYERPRKRAKPADGMRPREIVCYYCHKPGHYAQDCRKRKRDEKMRSHPSIGLPSLAGDNHIYMMGGGILRKSCEIEGRQFTAILDTGASVNVIRRQAANVLRAPRIRAETSVQVVGSTLKLEEAIELVIKLDRTTAQITAYVAEDLPADLLLGTPFLMKYSVGFKCMFHEFAPVEERPILRSSCVATEKGRLERLLDKYPKLVLGDDEMPDPNRFYRGQAFQLGLPEEKRDKIYFRPQYPPTHGQVEKYREILEPLIKAGVYVKTSSPHNNPTMLVPKRKPGQFRLVVDNRLVNSQCKPVGGMSASPLSIIKSMSGARIFTTLDCKTAFYSLVLTERDREFTAISPPGMPRLELTRMPMGARASTAALYQAMVATLGRALYRYALVWADDIIIYSQNEDDHVRHVDDVLHKLDENGFCITRSKIELGMPEVRWLGYRISAEGVRPDDEKVKQLLGMRRPQTLQELRSAIGMWTYFATFIPRYSIIAAPLMKQLQKTNTTLVWSEECIQAWEDIKRKLASAPIIGFANYSMPLFLHTDACKSGFAAVLTQERNSRHVLVDAISRTTTAPS